MHGVLLKYKVPNTEIIYKNKLPDILVLVVFMMWKTDSRKLFYNEDCGKIKGAEVDQQTSEQIV